MTIVTLDLAPEARAQDLAREWEDLPAQEMLRRAIGQEFAGKIALVSSFGAESAALLHLCAQIDRALPVIFIDTDRHFAQTLDYVETLAAKIGMTDLRVVKPDPAEAAAEDAKGDLWKRDPDACCALRKVRPNEAALKPFAAWISGRKRHHGGARGALPAAEHDGLHFKINPLIKWSARDIRDYMIAHDLPPHPLVAEGYPSIGCWPCTAPAIGDDPRAGRWAGRDKTECGIHMPLQSAKPRQQAF